MDTWTHGHVYTNSSDIRAGTGSTWVTAVRETAGPKLPGVMAALTDTFSWTGSPAGLNCCPTDTYTVIGDCCCCTICVFAVSEQESLVQFRQQTHTAYRLMDETDSECTATVAVESDSETSVTGGSHVTSSR